jgi:pre-mRNA-processing factor 6
VAGCILADADVCAAQEKREDVIAKCVLNEPRHGVVWQAVAKEPRNAALTTEEVLKIVAGKLEGV